MLTISNPSGSSEAMLGETTRSAPAPFGCFGRSNREESFFVGLSSDESYTMIIRTILSIFWNSYFTLNNLA